MKKLPIVLLALFLLGGLVACSSKQPPVDETQPTLTTFEKVQSVKASVSLGVDHQDVRHNLVLPRTLYLEGDEILVSWRSDNRGVLNDEGHVNRPAVGAGHANVTLTATFVLGGTQDYKDFFLTVPELPDGDMALVEEATNNLILYPGNVVDKDFLILPRVSDFGSHVEWISSDETVVDLLGNVNRPLVGQPDKTVILSATITLGNAMMFRDYTLTVKAPSRSYGVEITVTDSRILRQIPVSNKIAFLSALLTAQPGDAIILENGNYYDVNITMTKSGTSANPIFIMARNPGEAKIMGESQLYVKADHVVIAHLTFTNGSPSTDRGAIWMEGNHLRLTNTLMKNFERLGDDYKWLSMTGQYHEVDNNTFDGKETGGALLTIWRDHTGPDFHHIHNNQFKNYKDGGGANGYETIRLGTSHYSQSDSYSIIEENLFEAVNGEIEIISLKAGRTVVRNNTFVSSLGHITARHGKNNVIEGNAFFANGLFDTGGIRAYDGGHIIRNNYIDSVDTGSNTRGGIVIHSGVNVVGTNTVLNAQWTPFNMLIEANTIVNSRQSILFDGKYSLASDSVVLKNNLIIARPGQAAVRYDKLPTNALFENNFIYSDTAYAGGGAIATVHVPAGVTFSSILPQLSPNAQGMRLHPTMGAQNVMRIDASNSGVSWLR